MLLGLFLIILVIILIIPYSIELDYCLSEVSRKFTVVFWIWKLPIKTSASFSNRLANYWLTRSGQKKDAQKKSLFGQFADVMEHFLKSPVIKYLVMFAPSRWRFPVEIGMLELKFRYSTGDAALTSIACGLIWCCIAGIFTYINDRFIFFSKPLIKIIPLFGPVSADIYFHCIFRIRLGHIIIENIKQQINKVF
ncbi:MAG: DUF2953 domain-containing protein [Firmicutes bacterium]|nr:DUF2953 domain-containing protein [Bacillota bacterium]